MFLHKRITHISIMFEKSDNFHVRQNKTKNFFCCCQNQYCFFFQRRSHSLRNNYNNNKLFWSLLLKCVQNSSHKIYSKAVHILVLLPFHFPMRQWKWKKILCKWKYHVIIMYSYECVCVVSVYKYLIHLCFYSFVIWLPHKYCVCSTRNSLNDSFFLHLFLMMIIIYYDDDAYTHTNDDSLFDQSSKIKVCYLLSSSFGI